MSSEVGQRRYLFVRDYYRSRRRHRQARRNSDLRRREIYRPTRLSELDLSKIADPENLLVAYEECRRDGGQAPGVDGLTYSDLSRTEVGQALRVVSRAILARRYRPCPPRLIRVPKPNGGCRELRLATIIDRAVSTALAEAITPGLDTLFLPQVYGFRPRRGIWDMLVDIERTMNREDRWVVAQDDIRHAFPSVRIDDVLDDFRLHIADPGTLWLLGTVLRGHAGQARTLGIDQGSAVSPAALNLRLHHCLDLPLSAAGPGTPPWLRYADDVVFLTRGVTEGHQALQRAHDLLQTAGFTCKTDAGPPTDLRRQGARAEILGYQVHRQANGLGYHLGKKAWRNLAKALEAAHMEPHPTHAAQQCVLGWLSAHGPALESATEHEILAGIHRTAARLGYREPGDQQVLTRQLREARDRWLRLRTQAMTAPAAPTSPYRAPACSARPGSAAPLLE